MSTRPKPIAPAARVVQDADRVTVTTPTVSLQLLVARGGAVEQLAFPTLASSPLIGTAPHGAFEDIRYAADFYTGHVVGFLSDNRKVTDLAPAVFEWPADLTAYPIRIPVRATVATPIGTMCKTYYVHTCAPQVDVCYEFYLDTVDIASLRLGMVTALPGAFSPQSLRYETVNGGADVEHFALHADAIDHGSAVNPRVSARHCLGATEGWVSIGDDNIGVATLVDRRAICAVPLIEYAALDEGPFLRVSHSVIESDETAANIWRGYHRATISWLGHRADLSLVRNRARSLLVPPVAAAAETVSLVAGVTGVV